MDGNVEFGAITSPALTWFDNALVAAFTTTSAAGTLITAASTAPATATWMMPIEAEDYTTVPRLSPLDAKGWKAYAPDVATST